MPPQIKQAKLETLEAIIKEVEKQMAIHTQLAGEWTGISVTDFTKQRTNPHTEKVEALSDLLTKLNEQLTLLKNER